jgi:TM2 domain-containing membrane protein YozV
MAGTGVAPPPQVLAQAGPEAPAHQTPSPLAYYYPVAQPKTRVTFVLLGIFLGVFGVHNFYAGYAKKGAIQLCVTLLSCFYGALVSWIWAIIEICTVNKDAEGTQFV